MSENTGKAIWAAIDKMSDKQLAHRVISAAMESPLRAALALKSVARQEAGAIITINRGQTLLVSSLSGSEWGILLRMEEGISEYTPTLARVVTAPWDNNNYYYPQECEFIASQICQPEDDELDLIDAMSTTIAEQENAALAILKAAAVASDKGTPAPLQLCIRTNLSVCPTWDGISNILTFTCFEHIGMVLPLVRGES